MEHRQQAQDDFNKARTRANLDKILALIRREQNDLLSLDEVKAVVKPYAEVYTGIKSVPVSLIVGSEGRYRDFNRFYLPRHKHLRGRWVNVDTAHHKQIILPPVHLYEIGGVYFVRDGNHRVSVAVSQGVEFIDAEIISLKSKIAIKPGMDRRDLLRAVVDLEQKAFYDQTRLELLRPDVQMLFSATGRYDEIMRQIEVHKYFLNMKQPMEIPFEQAMLSWYDTVFQPIVQIIRDEHIVDHFSGRTPSDLYVWAVRHWHELKERSGGNFPLRQAVLDFKERFGSQPRGFAWLKSLFRRDP